MAKASDNEFPSVLFAEQASTPTTPATGNARLFVDSADGLFKWVDDAGTVTEIGGGTDADAIHDNVAGEIAALTLVTAASGDHVLIEDASDSNNKKRVAASDFIGGAGTSDAELVAGPLPSYDAGESILWGGTDSSGMTTVTVTGAQTITEGSGQISTEVTSNMTAEDTNCLLAAKTFTIGDEWMVRTDALALGGTASGDSWRFGLVITDGTTSAANCVFAHVQQSVTGNALLVGRHGTLTNTATAPWVSDGQIKALTGPVWIKIIYQASNTFRVEFSPDGVSWSAFGESDISKTMTPTHVGIAWSWIGATAYKHIYNYSALLKAA